MASTKPAVWVGCLACYNGGDLVGRWVDGVEADTVTVESLHTEHKVTPHPLDMHEELWCMDHEGFGGLLTGECAPVDAQRLAEAIRGIEADGHPVAAVAAWLSDTGETLSEWDGPTAQAFEDAYAGEWDDIEAYAADYIESTGEVDSGTLAGRYFDVAAFARDLVLGGDVWTSPADGGGVYVFHSC